MSHIAAKILDGLIDCQCPQPCQDHKAVRAANIRHIDEVLREAKWEALREASKPIGLDKPEARP